MEPQAPDQREGRPVETSASGQGTPPPKGHEADHAALTRRRQCRHRAAETGGTEETEQEDAKPAEATVDEEFAETQNTKTTRQHTMWEWLAGWGANPTIILAAIGVIAAIWKLGRWTERIENGLRTVDDRIATERKALEDRMTTERKTLEDRINTSVKTLGERIDTGLRTLREEIRHERSETRSTLDTLLLLAGGRREQTTAGRSPPQLTELGKEIDAKLEPTEWMTAAAEELRPQTKGLEPFEIEALCGKHIESSLDTKWQRRVARTAYELGTDTRAVEDVLRVILRNALLQRDEPSSNPPNAA